MESSQVQKLIQFLFLQIMLTEIVDKQVKAFSSICGSAATLEQGMTYVQS